MNMLARAAGPDEQTAAPLTQALADEDWTVRRNATQALGKLGPDAQEALPELKRPDTRDSGRLKEAVPAAIAAIEGTEPAKP